MLKKTIGFVFTAMVLIIITFSYSHASTVTLDGVANSGWWADDLTSSYLYVKNNDTDQYLYKWRYGVNPNPPAWSSVDEIIEYYKTQGINNCWLESGGDPFNNQSNPIWTNIFLNKGSYSVSLANDSEAYFLGNINGNNIWNAYVQMYSPSNNYSYNFGEGSYTKDSVNNVLDYYHANVDGKSLLSIKENTTLFLYINDYNSVDNSGSVKLNIVAVPEPSSYLLFIIGIILLASWNPKRSKSSQDILN